jgi:uncharacterized protein YicC (UPF0701 family)
MKSMTGYGRGECARDGFKITVELSAVNRRQPEISVNLPRELEMLESPVRDAINAQVARGRVTARIGIHAADGKSSARAHLNLPLAKAYATELARLAKSLKISGEISLVVEKALKPALAALVKMREREGAHLAEDLASRIGVMRQSAGKIQKQSPETAENYRRHLLERIRSAGIEAIAPDDERLLKEVVVFADRSDITEELTRLQSHFQQFEDCRKSNEPVGRTLDFLAQEMNREINTVGSKANDAVISREVVTLKAELERFREQAQNVE